MLCQHVIPCERLDHAHACLKSIQLLGAFCEMIRFINCVAQFVNSQNALQFIKKKDEAMN